MIKLKKLLVEIDWEKFADVSKTNLTPEDVAARLNAELDRLKQPSTKRDKADISFARLSYLPPPINVPNEFPSSVFSTISKTVLV